MKRLAIVLAAVVLMVPVGLAAQSQEGLRGRTAHPPIHVRRSSTAAPTGYGPADIQKFYGFSALYTVGTTGKGQVIAIVDAFDDPTIAADLGQFITTFGLPPMTTSGCKVGAGSSPPCFQKVYAQGSKPNTDGGWALEISLDVEWAHAIAPGADILLVEAADSSLANLLSAVATAAGTAGVHVVSMSWGAGEFFFESLYDSYFAAQNVMFVAASGDNGSLTWPAASPYVVGAGGTMFPNPLNAASCPSTAGECVWDDAYLGSSYASVSTGGGTSAVYAEPSYQSNFQHSGLRGVPDVAYYADIYPGYSIYDTTPNNGQTGWFAVGGTSASSPQWAALLALVNQLRAAKGICCLPTPVGSPSPAALYTVAGTSYNNSYHDVTVGCNTVDVCAGPGYDFATGIGSPQAYNLVINLSAGSSGGSTGGTTGGSSGGTTGGTSGGTRGHHPH